MNRLLFLACCLLGVSAFHLPASAQADRPRLEAELARVRADLEKGERDLAARQEALRREQHDLEYQDPELVALREKLIALEKQVLETRDQLKARLALKPGIKALEAERKELFHAVRRLRETEAAIRRELAAVDQAPE